MKVFSLFGLLMKFPERYEAKGIKQQMIENRMKFDRDVLAHGYEDYDEYDEWDPFLDLEGSASIFIQKFELTLLRNAVTFL